MESKLNIITLPHRVDRHESFKKEMLEQGIEYNIRNGVEDKQFPYRGINRAHKLVVEWAKSEGLKNVIIAEDDIKFSAPGAWNYFMSQIPESYDLFFGMIYAGSVSDKNKILNGFSGMTLYSVHERFYDFFLKLPDADHIDRRLGRSAFIHEYFICDPNVCYQSGGYSDNKKQTLYYDEYTKNKKFFGLTAPPITKG